MSTSEFIAKQSKILNDLEKNNKPLLIAVKSVMALQSKRIFIDAKNADGAEIGEYKGGEIYVNPENSPKSFPAKGKDGTSKFKNGDAHKDGYFSSYLAFKKAIGRNKNTNSVDLLLSGELSKDWANAEQISNANATRIDASHYIVGIRQHNADKVKRYGNVFGLQKSERAAFLKVIQFELGKLFKGDQTNN